MEEQIQGSPVGGAGKAPQKTSATAETYEWAESIVFALAIVVLIFTFIIRPVDVSGPSMQNTLQSGDKVVVSDINYTPKQGDIVVLATKAVTDPIIKRVVAVGGQTVNIDYAANKVYVDGKEFDAPIMEPMQPIPADGDGWGITKMPAKVPMGSVFVMGDNRNISRDSRYTEIGFIQDKYIIGHAIFRILPFKKLGFLH